MNEILDLPDRFVSGTIERWPSMKIIIFNEVINKRGCRAASERRGTEGTSQNENHSASPLLIMVYIVPTNTIKEAVFFQLLIVL